MKDRMLGILRMASRYRVKIPIMREKLLQEMANFLAVNESLRNADLDKDQRENAAARMAKRKAELDRKAADIYECKVFVNQVDLILASLPEEERTILEIYAEPGKPGTIIARAEEKLHCTKSQVYRIRDRALTRVYQILMEDEPICEAAFA